MLVTWQYVQTNYNYLLPLYKDVFSNKKLCEFQKYNFNLRELNDILERNLDLWQEPRISKKIGF